MILTRVHLVLLYISFFMATFAFVPQVLQTLRSFEERPILRVDVQSSPMYTRGYEYGLRGIIWFYDLNKTNCPESGIPFPGGRAVVATTDEPQWCFTVTIGHTYKVTVESGRYKDTATWAASRLNSSEVLETRHFTITLEVLMESVG